MAYEENISISFSKNESIYERATLSRNKYEKTSSDLFRNCLLHFVNYSNNRHILSDFCEQNKTRIGFSWGKNLETRNISKSGFSLCIVEMNGRKHSSKLFDLINPDMIYDLQSYSLKHNLKISEFMAKCIENH